MEMVLEIITDHTSMMNSGAQIGWEGLFEPWAWDATLFSRLPQKIFRPGP